MLLVATIPPRTDGTIIVDGVDGTRYIFEADKSGRLVCDVTDEDLARRIIACGNAVPLEVEPDAEQSEAPPKRRGRKPKADK